MNYEDVKICNCAGCGRELLAGRYRTRRSRLPEQVRDNPIVAGHILDRPYCAACLTVREITPGRSTPDDDGGPWQQNAVKAMEG